MKHKIISVTLLLLILTSCINNQNQKIIQKTEINVQESMSENAVLQKQDSIQIAKLNIDQANEIAIDHEIALINENISEHYQAKRTSAYEDFDFGEYYLLVKLTNGNLQNTEDEYFQYALLGEGVRTLKDGINLYQALNNKYKVKMSPTISYKYKNSDFTREQVDDFVFNSKIVKISENGEFFLRLTFMSNNMPAVPYSMLDWNYEVCDNNGSLYNYVQKKGLDSYSKWFVLNDFSGYYITEIDSLESLHKFNGNEIQLSKIINRDKNYYYWSSDGEYALLSNDYTFADSSLISITDGNIIRNIKLPDLSASCCIQQLLGKDKLLITLSDNYESTDIFEKAFLYDISLSSLYEVGNYMFHPLASPDLEIVAYRTPVSYEFYDEDFNNNYAGIYFKNIYSDKEFCYPLKKVYSNIEFVGWSRKSGVDKLIGTEE